MNLDELKFDENGLIPAIVVDDETGKVLTLAYMNRESLAISMEKKLTCFWSRSRQELWLKGETSGNYQHIVSITADCDVDAFKPAAVKLHVGNEGLRDLARRHAHELRACHGVVCRIVSVCGVLGYLYAAAERKPCGQLTLFGGREICGVYELRDLLFCLLYHICHIIYPLSF